MINIYGLAHPITKDIRYIGKSIRTQSRYNDHLKDNSKTHKSNWIQFLIKQGLKPILIILEEIEDCEDWQQKERDWIFKAKKDGWKLVNSTDGGDGVLNLSGDGKRRMLETWKGRKHKPETLLKLSKASKGRIKPLNSKIGMSYQMKGRKIKWKNKLKKAVRKFSNKDLKSVINDLKNGMKGIDVSKKYNVHRTTITKIKKGEYKTFKQKTVNYIKPRLYHTYSNNKTA